MHFNEIPAIWNKNSQKGTPDAVIVRVDVSYPWLFYDVSIKQFDLSGVPFQGSTGAKLERIYVYVNTFFGGGTLACRVLVVDVNTVFGGGVLVVASRIHDILYKR